MRRRVLFPLPDRDFDTTEVAVPWEVLRERGYDVVFATERGGVAPRTDPRLLDGVIFGKLGAAPDALAAYRELEQDPAFATPIAWSEIVPEDYAGLFLAGGHAPGMRQYLGSEPLQVKVAALWTLERPVAAICHGVLLLARARDPRTHQPLLHGRVTTCLPKYMERSAFLITCWRLGRYYRTYPAYVETEVREALAAPGDFRRGSRTLTKRGTRDDDGPAFVVEDGRYLSARWPGDAWLIAKRFADRLDAERSAIARHR